MSHLAVTTKLSKKRHVVYNYMYGIDFEISLKVKSIMKFFNSLCSSYRNQGTYIIERLILHFLPANNLERFCESRRCCTFLRLYIMGTLVSKDSDFQVQKQHSRFIDIEINAERRSNVHVVKLLLLGKNCYNYFLKLAVFTQLCFPKKTPPPQKTI